ncbi:AtpZ/AtpI family protein [Tautonia marina]|uniref:AtpZ/AtpI family protein n=1 Tax=Tautonia marina TaxID=2653855 RepID=UPI001260A6E7|nr:AtpZ/AtpI family protein [Tautonia marina]
MDPDHRASQDLQKQPEPLEDIVRRKAERKARAREGKSYSLWYGLGMFGLVGWSVAIPTLVGVAIGVLLDTRRSDTISWTLTGLGIGIIVGCLNAWFWVKRESRI